MDILLAILRKIIFIALFFGAKVMNLYKENKLFIYGGVALILAIILQPNLKEVVIRKGIVLLIFSMGWFLFDKFYCKAFDTDEVLKNDPKAIGQFLGLVAIAIAFA